MADDNVADIQSDDLSSVIKDFYDNVGAYSRPTVPDGFEEYSIGRPTLLPKYGRTTHVRFEQESDDDEPTNSTLQDNILDLTNEVREVHEKLDMTYDLLTGRRRRAGEQLAKIEAEMTVLKQTQKEIIDTLADLRDLVRTLIDRPAP